METFVTSIKQKYQERLINREKQWPPCHSDKLVRLELVEREKGEGYSAKLQRGKEDRYGGREGKTVKRTPLAYGDIFKVESGKRTVRKVLVEGDAGIGKTTLCVAASEDWANGKLFQQFELVLHLPLRMKAVGLAGTLPKFFQLLHSCEDVCDSVASFLKKTEGKSVLLIADGWDELSEAERQSDSFLYQLFFEMFPFISVIVTSRPSASASFHRLSCIDRFVEVQGFSKDHIVEYIQSEFASDQEKAGRLLEQLEYNPLIESVCSVPLNCAIVCHLWRTLEENLPTTMTELYTKIILNLVLRNICKIDTYKSVLSLPNFESLPADLQQPWWLLCEFAYQTLEKDQLIFSQEELAKFLPRGLALSRNILFFGLLQSAESIFDIGCGTSFHFLHLTFQEYLAALHLAKMLVDRQSNQPTIRFNIFDKVYVSKDVLLRFFFGIYFNVLKSCDCALIKPYLSSISNQKLVCCHCAFEAKNADIDDDIIGLFRNVFNFCHPHTAHDCTAVLYVINKMQECPSVEISFGNCHISENQIRALTDSLVSKDGKVQIKKLDLSGNKLTYKSLDDLLHRASSAFQSLERLDLRGYKLKPENIVTMLAKPSCHGLSHLNLSDNNLDIPGLQALENAVSAGQLANLEVLNLSGCLTDDADTNAAALEPFLESLSASCPNFDSINLSDNNIGVPGASVLAAAISQHNCFMYNIEPASYDLWLTSINLNNTRLGDEGLCAFIKELDLGAPYLFTNLYLQNNGIRATGLTCLANMFSWSGSWTEYDSVEEFHSYMYYDMNNCEELCLGDNPIGIEGIIAVGEMLSSSDLKYVELCRCQLTSSVDNISNPHIIKDVGQQLCQMPKAHNIFNLALDGNHFTGERIHILAGFICLCENLMGLICCDCNITSDDLILLLEIIARSKASYPDICSGLIIWHLDNNKIDDRGVSKLVHHVPSLFPSLGEGEDDDVRLDGNPISSEMVEKLKQKLLSLHRKDDPQSSGGDLSTSPSHSSFIEKVERIKQQEEALYVALPRPKTAQFLEELAITPCPQLDEVIDLRNGGVSKHLGQIADTMYEWEGPVAEQLGLTRADAVAIKTECPGKLRLQTRAALEKWKQRLGSSATYSNLIGVFERAGYQDYADVVKSVHDKPSIYQSVHEGTGNPLPQKCAPVIASATFSDNPIGRKRKASTTLEEGNIAKHCRKMEDVAAESQGESDIVYGYQSRSFTEAEKKAQVPFLFHTVLDIDNNGMEYTIENHDITVRFPYGAVAEGDKLQFEIGVAMYGPFKFIDDIRPISPIFWLCPLDERAIKLNKQFQLILPHFLSGDKVHNHQVGFAKANHNDYEENRYVFHVCDAESIFVSTGSKSYGILETNHCCFYCLEAKNTPQIAKDSGYALVTLESVKKQEVHFCAIYLLNTCLKSLEEQFPLEEGYQVSRCSSFKFNPDLGSHLNLKAHAEHSQCVITMDPIPAKIQEIDIDFWNTNFETLQLKHQYKMYPPRIKMTVDAPNIDPRIKLLVKFDGCSSDSQLDMEIFFPLRLSDAVECVRESDVTTVRSNTILMNCNGLADVEHQYLDLLKWQQHELSCVNQLKLYSRVSHKWELIATRLGFEPGNIDSLRRNNHDDYERVIAVFHRWFDDAKNLPNARKYPLSWQGLINLLEEAELGEVAKKLHAALSSPQSSVRQNL